MKGVLERVRNEPVLVLTTVLLLLSRWLSPDDLTTVQQVLELALYLGLGVVVRQQVTPTSKL